MFRGSQPFLEIQESLPLQEDPFVLVALLHLVIPEAQLDQEDRLIPWIQLALVGHQVRMVQWLQLLLAVRHHQHHQDHLEYLAIQELQQVLPVQLVHVVLMGPHLH